MKEPDIANDQDDPIIPTVGPRHELPGTEDSVRQELAGTSRYTGYAHIELVREANRAKNRGVQYALPRHTLPGVVLRLRPLTHGSMHVLQGEISRSVRNVLGIKSRQDLPQEGNIEVNRQLIVRSLMEWTDGETDVAGARKAARLKNRGIRYAFPNNLLPSVVLRLRPLSHPYITLVRSERDTQLRERLGIRKDDELPPEAGIELDRAMILASILGWEDGSVQLKGSPFSLKGRPRTEVREWFAENFLPPANLRERPPRDQDEREEFFANMFADLNNDVLHDLLQAQEFIRRSNHADILSRGSEYTVGSDWEPVTGSGYSPGELTTWKGKSPRELQALFTEFFLPQVDLKQRPPSGEEAREAFYEAMFESFSNEILNELLEGQDQIRRADPQEILGKGSDFVCGRGDDTGSSD